MTPGPIPPEQINLSQLRQWIVAAFLEKRVYARTERNTNKKVAVIIKVVARWDTGYHYRQIEKD